ncbi:MAG: hypothetical protein R2879_01310 [Saprospiraceae bacterium]
MRTLFKNINLFTLFSAFLTMFLFACNDYSELRQKMVEESYQQKIEEFIGSKNKECREEAISIASQKVDSILIARAKLNKDTLNKPIIPEKPIKPEIKQPLDSSDVGPILGKEKGVKD